MAKTKMLCPFSKKLCRECPQYRGRHYYLCFQTKYRGYMGRPKVSEGQRSWSRGINMNFDMPLKLPQSPKWLIMNDFAERKER